MLRYVSAGESHGKCLSFILEGIPSGLKIDLKLINNELKRRQFGYGRGARMSIEKDEVEIVSGVRGGITTGAPICGLIANKDFENWKDIIGVDAARIDERCLTKVRPGHADLSGCIKYEHKDARNILERASARETACRVAAGAICKQLLMEADIEVASYVSNIGGVGVRKDCFDIDKIRSLISNSSLACIDSSAEKEMIKRIDFARENKDTLGGEAVLVSSGMPVGVGSYSQYDRKLDFIVSGHIASIQAFKSVAIGAGADYADNLGSKMHDEIYIKNNKIFRKTNNAGGIEGGMSNGENIIVRAIVKPIPTLMNGLKTVDIKSGLAAVAQPERSDVCAVAAAAVVGENALAIALAYSLLDTFGGDNIKEFKDRISARRRAADDFIR